MINWFKNKSNKRVILLILSFLLFSMNYYITNYYFPFDTDEQQRIWWINRLALLSLSFLFSILAFYNARNSNLTILIYDIGLGLLITDIYERWFYNEASFNISDLLLIFIPILIDIFKYLKIHKWKSQC